MDRVQPGVPLTGPSPAWCPLTGPCQRSGTFLQFTGVGGWGGLDVLRAGLQCARVGQLCHGPVGGGSSVVTQLSRTATDQRLHPCTVARGRRAWHTAHLNPAPPPRTLTAYYGVNRFRPETQTFTTNTLKASIHIGEHQTHTNRKCVFYYTINHLLTNTRTECEASDVFRVVYSLKICL